MAQAHFLDLNLPGNIAFMATSEAVGDAWHGSILVPMGQK